MAYGFARPGARACYEAGPTGFGLYRAASAAGIAVEVIAPGKTPRGPSDRVKTDRKDAELLARLLLAGSLTTVVVPPVEVEAARELMRAQVTLGLGVRCLGRGQVRHTPLQVSSQADEFTLVPLYEAVQHLLRRVFDELRADLDPWLIRHRQLFRASALADGEALGVGAVGTVA